MCNYSLGYVPIKNFDFYMVFFVIIQLNLCLEYCVQQLGNPTKYRKLETRSRYCS